MKKVILILTILLLASCGVCRKSQPSQTDSVRVEYRDRIIHDTTTLEIPKIVEKVVTRDTASHLENAYAVSDASYTDGFLSHSLESIPQIIKVPYTVEVHDTTIVEKASEVIVQKVEKPLKWHQKFKINAFWWLLAIIAFAYRKYIIAFVKFIITKI